MYLLAMIQQVLTHTLVTLRNVIWRHPQRVAFNVIFWFIPGSWIVMPILRLFGFGPLGPVAGSIAAWMQRYFWGAAVQPGSWFAFLQAAGMGILPKWAGPVFRATRLLVGGILALFTGFRRG